MLSFDEIESEVLSLPRPERDRLTQTLIASLDMDPEVERAWEEEIRRRIRDIDSGVTKLIPGEEVMKEFEDSDDDSSRIGDEESARRYEAFLAGNLPSYPAPEALAELRRHIVD